MDGVLPAEVMANAGFDGLFLGPTDLASSLGCWPPVWDDQPAELAAAIARVPAVAHECGKAAGIMVPTADVANHCIRLGYEFIALTSDAALLEQAARRELAAVAAAGG